MIENKLIKNDSVSNKTITFTVNGDDVKLSPNIIKNYLVAGDGRISDEEAIMFLNLCKYAKLNPFLREAYLVKYGSKPATMIVGKDVFLKRAYHNDKFKGFEAGVVIVDKNGKMIERQGSLLLLNETLVGGWAKVYINGFDIPIMAMVSYNEYVGKKGDGTANSMWSGKPATMIRKVALSQALREAFPDSYSGLYTAEETQIDEEKLNNAVINVEEVIKKEESEVVKTEIIETTANRLEFEEI